MFPEQRTAVRVGLWVLGAAVIAGLLVLALHRGAQASEPPDLHAAAQALASREPPSAAERLAQADAVLHQDRKRRLRRVYAGTIEGAWRLGQHASPRSALRTARRVLRGIAELWERSPAEDDALELLEIARRTPDSDAVARQALESRYRELRARERRHLAEQSLDRAIESRRPSLARLRLERCLELDPELERARELLARLDRDGGFGSLVGARPVSLPVSPVRHESEAALAASLLAGDYERALGLEPRSRGDELARGVAQYLAGQRGEALSAFESLAEVDDAIGAKALEWSERPELDPGSALEREWRRYRADRALGWIGGGDLVARGFDVSPDGYRAWKESLTPLNLALLLPWRAYTDWRPDGSDVREAAERYLDLRPDGPLAGEASELLDEIPTERPREWDDARFVLPRARTPHPRLVPDPLLITSQALSELALDPEVLAALDGADALVLLPTREARGGSVSPERVRSLLAALARGVESGALDPVGRERSATLDVVRRLDAAAGRGLVGVRVRPWTDARGLRELGNALMFKESASVRAFTSERNEDGIRFARQLDATAPACPDGFACIHRTRGVDGAIYARVDEDADLRVGAYTTFDRAHLALQVGPGGPQATLVVPVGRWLGLGRWLPIEAQVDLGAERIGFMPRLGPVQTR